MIDQSPSSSSSELGDAHIGSGKAMTVRGGSAAESP
jgi:hypothetical protein